MLVHRCCVYKKEIQPCRTKYRGIWAILMHKIMFPSESCNSVLKGRLHSVNSVRFPLSQKCSPRVPPEPLRVPHFGNRCCTAFHPFSCTTLHFGHKTVP